MNGSRSKLIRYLESPNILVSVNDELDLNQTSWKGSMDLSVTPGVDWGHLQSVRVALILSKLAFNVDIHVELGTGVFDENGNPVNSWIEPKERVFIAWYLEPESMVRDRQAN